MFELMERDEVISDLDKTNDTTTNKTDTTNPKTGNATPTGLVITSLAAVAIVTKNKLVK